MYVNYNDGFDLKRQVQLFNCIVFPLPPPGLLPVHFSEQQDAIFLSFPKHQKYLCTKKWIYIYITCVLYTTLSTYFTRPIQIQPSSHLQWTPQMSTLLWHLQVRNLRPDVIKANIFSQAASASSRSPEAHTKNTHTHKLALDFSSLFSSLSEDARQRRALAPQTLFKSCLL